MTSGAVRFQSAKRIVVKLGSALLTSADGTIQSAQLKSIADDIAALKARNVQIVLVSSGAVALGRSVLNLPKRGLKLEDKQAAAAAGQPRLMRAWEDAFASHNIPVAQALVTLDDTERRRRWLNARATLTTLMDAGAIPVVNENDTVATEEIRYGDNDRLAARVAQMISADHLILLSDIDGLYTADPRKTDDAEHIPHVTEITSGIIAMGGDANADAGVGTGGMATKLAAAQIAWHAGCTTVIAKGDEKNPIATLETDGRSTWFVPPFNPEKARKQWLSGALKPAGAIIVDDGAVRALENGKSLLPAGVVDVTGQFERGDAVDVTTRTGDTIARGICAYSAHDARLIMGRNSSETEDILGYKGRPALIHRDDMTLLHVKSLS